MAEKKASTVRLPQPALLRRVVDAGSLLFDAQESLHVPRSNPPPLRAPTSSKQPHEMMERYEELGHEYMAVADALQERRGSYTEMVKELNAGVRIPPDDYAVMRDMIKSHDAQVKLTRDIFARLASECTNLAEATARHRDYAAFMHMLATEEDEELQADLDEYRDAMTHAHVLWHKARRELDSQGSTLLHHRRAISRFRDIAGCTPEEALLPPDQRPKPASPTSQRPAPRPIASATRASATPAKRKAVESTVSSTAAAPAAAATKQSRSSSSSSSSTSLRVNREQFEVGGGGFGNESPTPAATTTPSPSSSSATARPGSKSSAPGTKFSLGSATKGPPPARKRPLFNAYAANPRGPPLPGSALTTASSAFPYVATGPGSASLKPVSGPTTSLVHNRGSDARQRAVAVMTQWLRDNLDNPYPTEADCSRMAKEVGRNLASVKQWFANLHRSDRKLLKELREERDNRSKP